MGLEVSKEYISPSFMDPTLSWRMDSDSFSKFAPWIWGTICVGYAGPASHLMQVGAAEVNYWGLPHHSFYFGVTA